MLNKDIILNKDMMTVGTKKTLSNAELFNDSPDLSPVNDDPVHSPNKVIG